MRHATAPADAFWGSHPDLRDLPFRAATGNAAEPRPGARLFGRDAAAVAAGQPHDVPAHLDPRRLTPERAGVERPGDAGGWLADPGAGRAADRGHPAAAALRPADPVAGCTDDPRPATRAR